LTLILLHRLVDTDVLRAFESAGIRTILVAQAAFVTSLRTARTILGAQNIDGTSTDSSSND